MKLLHRALFSTISCLVILGGCNSSPTSTLKTGATTATVSRQDLVGYTFFDAQVITPPTAQAVVYAPFKLPVSEVLVAVGKQVSKGDVLIKLAMPEAKVMVQQAQGGLMSAQAAYSAAKAQNEGPMREMAKSLAEARAAEAAARKDEASAESPDLSGLAQARKDAEDGYRQAKSEFDSYVAAERQAVEFAVQVLNEAKAGAKQTVIRAPISGTVTSLTATVGSDIGADPKALVATITDFSAIELRLTVPADQKDAVQSGTAVVFSGVQAGVGPLEGKVTSLRINAKKANEKSATYVASVSFDNSKGMIRPETIVKKAGVRSGKVEKVLVVPVGAVSQNSSGKMVVQVQKGADWIETPVETGLSDGALIEIKSGLDEGAIVKVATLVQQK